MKKFKFGVKNEKIIFYQTKIITFYSKMEKQKIFEQIKIFFINHSLYEKLVLKIEHTTFLMTLSIAKNLIQIKIKMKSYTKYSDLEQWIHYNQKP